MLTLHQLLDAGFVANTENEKGTHIYTGKIAGVRYLSKGQSFQHYSRLNNDYTITVKIPYSAAGIAGRALLTPIAVANDGIATIALIPLFILAIPFAIDMMLEDEQSPKQDISTTNDSILI